MLGIHAGSLCAQSGVPGLLSLQVRAVYRAQFAPPPDLVGLMEDHLEVILEGKAQWRWQLGKNGTTVGLQKLSEEATVAGGGAGFIHTVDNLDWTYAASRQSGDDFFKIAFDRQSGTALLGIEDILDAKTLVLTPPFETPMALNLIRLADNALSANTAGRTVQFSSTESQYTATGVIQAGTPREYLPSSGTIEVYYTISYTDYPVEAVLTPAPQYPLWLPAAHPAPTTPGTNLAVTVALRVASDPSLTPPDKAFITFKLRNVSQEPGACLNAPAAAQASLAPDLRFVDQAAFTISEDGLTATTKAAVFSAQVQVGAYDWGAFGELEATVVTTNQQEIPVRIAWNTNATHLSIPLDDNGNHIADGWEKGMGILESNLPPEWASSPLPPHQRFAGDGLSLYEKYRGFILFGAHERLDPMARHLFIHDPDGVVALAMTDPRCQSINITNAAQCRVCWVDDADWSGAGQGGQGRRIVNFNTSGLAHLVNQHALDVRAALEEEPGGSGAWQDILSQAGFQWGGSPTRNTLGLAFPDPSQAGGVGSPRNVMLCVLYLNQMTEYLRNTVVYHTLGLDRFAHWEQLPPAERAAMAREIAAEADQYIADHPADYWTRSLKQTATVVTHELGHGVGILDHDPAQAGDPLCLMRAFGYDLPRNPLDRFELQARTPWPNLFCASTNATHGLGCQGQIKITDQ